MLLSRSHFLAGALGALGAFALPRRAIADSNATPLWQVPGYPGSRVLWIYTDEDGMPKYNMRIPFYFPGVGLDRRGYLMLCAIMRDPHVSFVKGDAYIDPKHIHGLFEIQVAAAQQGYGYRPIRVFSAFRTTETNSTIPGAVPNSYHIKGQASDFDMPGLPMRTVYDIADALAKADAASPIPNGYIGGLGYYRDHIHGDSGPAGRRW